MSDVFKIPLKWLYSVDCGPQAWNAVRIEWCFPQLCNSLPTCRDFPEQKAASLILFLPQTRISGLCPLQLGCPFSSSTNPKPIIPYKTNSNPTSSMTHGLNILRYSLYSNDSRPFSTAFKILHVFNGYVVSIHQIPGPGLDTGWLN